MKRKIKVLTAKPGLDGHNRGIKVVSQALKEAGMEVVYIGIRQTPEGIIKAAIEEDVDVVGLSSLSGAHMPLFSVVAKLAREKGLNNIILIGGGIIPEEDRQELSKAGFNKIFGPGTRTSDIVDFIKEVCGARS